MAKFSIPSFYMPNSLNEIIVSEIGFTTDNANEARAAANLTMQFMELSGVSRTGEVYTVDMEEGTSSLGRDGFLNVWDTPLGLLHVILIGGPMYDMLKSKENQYEEVLQIRKNPNYHEGNLTIN